MRRMTIGLAAALAVVALAPANEARRGGNPLLAALARAFASLDARLAENREKEVFELEPGVVDPEHLERLRALGYIE